MLNELRIPEMADANFLTLIILTAPALFLLTSIIARSKPGTRPLAVIRAGMAATGASLIASVYGIIVVCLFGLTEGTIVEVSGIGLSFRLDPLSMLMFTMIALLGFVVLKYSRNYLDGDARHGVFIGRLASTIAAVQLLVLSGNLLVLFLAWIMTSLMLHRLLIFYPERRRAVIAARKKFIVARLGDIFLLAASVLMYIQYSTGNLQLIFDALKGSNRPPYTVEIAAVFLAFAALLKSAQFPTHGWLIEVMETPTPVSALLHAGLLNAGPFLMVRMAYVISRAEAASIVLIVFGGLTALLASISYTTQPSIKTALGYSSAAHMGFMLLVCGIGVFPAAMLHLVAHSFYKAHAFLSSGSAVDIRRASKVPEPKRIGSPIRIVASVIISFVVYLGFAMLWRINPANDFALLATGAIVVMGLSQIIAPALDSDGYFATTLRAILLTLLVAASFFTLESVFHHVLYSQLPPPSKPDTATILLTVAVLIVFGLTVLAQIWAPAAKQSIFRQKIGVHFRNGFYMNALFDRLTGAFSVSSPAKTRRPFEYRSN